MNLALSGICACCGNTSVALYTCRACGSRCCLRCVDQRTGFCKLCGGIKRLK